MNFKELIKLENQGVVCKLYSIKLNNTVFNFTDNNEDIIVDGVNYIAINITVGNIVHNESTFDNKVKIKLPVRSQFARIIQNQDVSSETSVTITMYNKTYNVKRVLWVGVLYTREFEKDTLYLVSLNRNYKSAKVLNRGVYSRECPHQLYDSLTCRLDRSNFSTTATISDIKNKQFLLDVALDDKFLAGYIDNGKVTAMIIKLDGNTAYTLNSISTLFKAGDKVTIYQGCDKSLNCCKERFNNVDNYGGFPTIPIKNIFTSNLQG